MIKPLLSKYPGHAVVWLALAFFVTVARFAQAQVFADDDAGNYLVSDNWTNGANKGLGFTPWKIVTSGPNNHGNYVNANNNPMFVIASVTNASGVSYTNVFGIFANGTTGTNETAAYRGFAAPLGTNTFKLQWGSRGAGVTTVNGSPEHGWCGFTLRNGNATNTSGDFQTGARFSLYFLDGSSPNTLYVSDGNGVQSLTGVTFSDLGRSNITNAIAAEVTVGVDGDSYHLILKDVVVGKTLYTLDSILMGSGTLDSVALFCRETTGDQIYNRMQIVVPHIPPTIKNILPANGSIFVNPDAGVSFEVDSLNPDLLGVNVTLLLNGVVQTLVFNTNSVTKQLLATNTIPLAANVQYSAAIIAVDVNGNSATNIFSFDTIQTNSLWRDVKSHGATGDGITMDTAAIQSAINACPAGGFVWLHNGTYLSGTIYLKNDMTLYIDPTATLLGSGSVADYPAQTPPLSNSQTLNCQRALVYAESCTNVTVTGGGTINGNGRANFRSGLEATRPIAIWTTLCNHVNLQNINIVDAGMWTVVPMQSDFLTISNLTINDDGLNGNRDGIDPVDCWHVMIANCTINSGDDAICLKSGNARGVNDVLVKNCTITRSQSNGFKFGTASKGPFTNITFQDCTLQNISHSAMAVESVDGGAVSDVTFQRISFSSCQNAIFIALGSRSGATVGSISGITFRDIAGSGLTDTRGCPISGCLTNGVVYRLKNILFDNVNITYAGGLGSIPSNPPEYAGQYPENTMWGNLPAYGYYIRHATNVTFTGCFTSAASADARPWIATNDVPNLKIFGPMLNILPSPSPLVLQWNSGFTLQTATNIAGPFTDLTGATSLYTNQISSAPQRFFRLRQ
jgi:polygalacturonase